MKPFPPYRKIPIPTTWLIAALFVLMMAVWVQGDFTPAYAHLLLLIASYLTWGVMLPFIQGMIESKIDYSFNCIIRLLLQAFLLIGIHFVISNALYYFFQFLFFENFSLPTADLLIRIIGPSMLSRSIDFILFFGVLSWLFQTQNLSRKNLELMQVEANLQESRLAALKSQLNPHFLFNTLHTVSSLIGREDEKARDLTIKISGLLRKVLVINEKSKHALREEIDFIEDYLSIETERFHDRLILKKNIQESCLDVMVPTMILQPLIENAFKHGISLIEGKTELKIDVTSDEQYVTLQVINEVAKGQSTIPSTGVGLKNLTDRLHAFYSGDVKFKHQITSDNTFVCTVQLPVNQ